MRQGAREVRRQLRESGATGVVAILLVAVATTWGGVLWLTREWIMGELLAHGRPATIVAAASSLEAAQTLQRDLVTQFPGTKSSVSAPAVTREELARWFPELSAVLLGLEDGAFPPLVEAEASPQHATAMAEWLRKRPETVLVESSRDWQGRLERTFASVMLVGFSLALALLVGCCVVVLLVVRLLVLEHADEIAIMRLIGARERDIRWPYLACGAALGLIGGAAGIAAIFALWAPLRGRGVDLDIPALVLGLIPVASGVIGAIGAALGLAALPEEP